MKLFKMIRHIRETSDSVPPCLKGASKESKQARESKLAAQPEEDDEEEEDYDEEEEEDEGMDDELEEDINMDVPACARAPKVPEPKKVKKAALEVTDEPPLPTPCRRLQRKCAMQESDVLYVRTTVTAELDELEKTLQKIEDLKLRPFFKQDSIPF